MPDLRDGIIRTPLTPNETFQDDPLRVLRCVRFASRFGFDLERELQEAAKDPVIQVGKSLTANNYQGNSPLLPGGIVDKTQ